MKFEFPEEDRALIPLLIGSAVIAVGAHLIKFSREQKQIRAQIRKETDEEIASIRLTKEILIERMNAARRRQRARFNEILDPLRKDRHIDF